MYFVGVDVVASRCVMRNSKFLIHIGSLLEIYISLAPGKIQEAEPQIVHVDLQLKR